MFILAQSQNPLSAHHRAFRQPAENGRPAPVSLFELDPECPVEVCYLRDARRGESLSLFGKSKGASKFGQAEFSSFMRTALITERELPERRERQRGGAART